MYSSLNFPIGKREIRPVSEHDTVGELTVPTCPGTHSSWLEPQWSSKSPVSSDGHRYSQQNHESAYSNISKELNNYEHIYNFINKYK